MPTLQPEWLPEGFPLGQAAAALANVTVLPDGTIAAADGRFVEAAGEVPWHHVRSMLPFSPTDATSAGSTVNTNPISLVPLGVMVTCVIILLLYELMLGEPTLKMLRNCGKPQKHATPLLNDPDAGNSQADEARSFCEKLTLFLLGCLGSFTGELYYGIIVPFFPVEVEARGIDPALIGILIACHAAGVIVFGQFAPNLLRWRDPLAIMRTTLLLQTSLSLACGLCGGLYGTAFGVTFGIFRFLLGGAATITEMCAQAIAFRCAPSDKIAAITATLVSIRTLGTLFAPTLGGVLYPIGGFPLPFIAGSCVFLALWIALFATNACTLPMDPIISTASVLKVLKVCRIWPALLATPFLGFFLSFSMEPLYNPVYSSPPYNLGFQAIGLIAAAIPVGMIAVNIGVATWLYNYIGPSWGQLIGSVLIFIGALLLGPSPIFGSGLTPSIGLAIGALFVIGSGLGVCVPTTPIFMLRILEREAGLRKAEVGGSLATTAMTFIMLGALTAPTISSAIYAAVGFPAFTTGWAFIYVALYIPCAVLLWKYNPAEDPAKASDPKAL